MAVTQEALPQSPEFSGKLPMPIPELVGAFDPSISGHVLVEPESYRSQVVSFVPEAAESIAGNPLGPGVKVYKLETLDACIATDPVGQKIFEENEAKCRPFYVDGYDPTVDQQRSEAKNEAEYNPLTAAWLWDDRVIGLRAWRDGHVPNATALGFLRRPVAGTFIDNPKGGPEGILTQEAAVQMSFDRHPVAIRARDEAQEFIISGAVEKFKDIPGPIRILSVGSGTAEPVIASAVATQQQHGKEIELTVVDIDKNALKMVEEVAELYGFTGKINMINENVLSPRLKQKIALKTGEPDPKYEIIESLGLMEYIKQDGNKLPTYRGQKMRGQASDFVSTVESMLIDDGVLMAANMVFDESDYSVLAELTQKFDWPLINARTEEEIVEIFQKADVIKQGAQLLLTRVVDSATQDHIYDIAVLEKRGSNTK